MRLKELNRKLISNKKELIKHKNKVILQEEKLLKIIHDLEVKRQCLNSRIVSYKEDQHQLSERISCINGHLNTARMLKSI